MKALVLAGGSGTRFWPLSRKLRPKQLLALEGDRSLLQATVDRLRPLVEPRSVWVCTTRALAAEVRRQLPEVPPGQVLAEPQGRNTAPAIGWSVRSLPEEERGGVVAVLPADHRVADDAAFRDALERAGRAVERDDLVMTLGIVPRWAETGYGYLELGEGLGEANPLSIGVRRVERFVEKPDAAAAARFHASGNHLWNAGIFVFRGTTFLGHLARLQPELARGLEAIAADPSAVDSLYANLPAESIDYAVMEKLASVGSSATVGTVPLDCGWSDLGSWAALEEILPKDGGGNAARGFAVAVDARGNVLVSAHGADGADGAGRPGVVAVLGVNDLVVVRTADAVLVCPRERAQEVKRLVAELARAGREDLL